MIRINNDYIIDVDKLEYAAKIDKHKQDNKGNDIYETVGHYSSLENAIKGVLESMNRKELSEDVHTLEEAIEIVKENNRQFTELFKKAVDDNEI